MKIQRINKACKYFPCHKGLEDCAFCYCPFYPCRDEKLGRFVHSSKRKEHIWSCQDCSWIHKTKVVNAAFSLIRENQANIKSKECVRKKGRGKFKDAGIVILGHGSRRRKAMSAMDDLVDTLKQRLETDLILPASMQLSQPDLAESIKKLISRNCKYIIIVPLFLFNGNHVRRDIPQMLKKEEAKYPQVKFISTKNLSKDARISDIVFDRIKEARSGLSNQRSGKNRGKKF